MVGAEDVNENEKGAFTGEVSARMLADIGVEWVIIGHSERRAMFGDSDERVGAKCRAAVGAGLRILPCVGETLQEREQGRTLEVVCRQLNAVLAAVGPEALAQGALAYEPVGAIGTGRTATPEQAQQVHAALRACVAQRSATAAQQLRILYGGSVKPANARELFGMADIDGGLVGGAALKADDFYSICAAVSA
jgi:triosephosphate isomerase